MDEFDRCVKHQCYDSFLFCKMGLTMTFWGVLRFEERKSPKYLRQRPSRGRHRIEDSCYYSWIYAQALAPTSCGTLLSCGRGQILSSPLVTATARAKAWRAVGRHSAPLSAGVFGLSSGFTWLQLSNVSPAAVAGALTPRPPHTHQLWSNGFSTIKMIFPTSSIAVCLSPKCPQKQERSTAGYGSDSASS